jgi:hypothetical protein
MLASLERPRDSIALMARLITCMFGVIERKLKMDSPAVKTRPPLTDPAGVMAVWASELTSIEIQGDITLLTFAQEQAAERNESSRRVCARIAISTKQLVDMARRIDGLQMQARAMATPTGTA